MNLNLIIVFALYVVVFASAEILYRWGLKAEFTRKIVHIGAAVVTFFLPVFVNMRTVAVIGLVFTIFLLWTQQRRFLKSVHGIKNENLGAALYPLGLALCAFIFNGKNPVVFQFSALVLGFSDGIAGLFGVKFGKNKYKIIREKTFEGSAAFFVVTFILFFAVFIFAQMSFSAQKMIYMILGAFALTVVEGVCADGWDNFFVPLSAGIVFFAII